MVILSNGSRGTIPETRERGRPVLYRVLIKYSIKFLPAGATPLILQIFSLNFFIERVIRRGGQPLNLRKRSALVADTSRYATPSYRDLAFSVCAMINERNSECDPRYLIAAARVIEFTRNYTGIPAREFCGEADFLPRPLFRACYFDYKNATAACTLAKMRFKCAHPDDAAALHGISRMRNRESGRE